MIFVSEPGEREVNAKSDNHFVQYDGGYLQITMNVYIVPETSLT